MTDLRIGDAVTVRWTYNGKTMTEPGTVQAVRGELVDVKVTLGLYCTTIDNVEPATTAPV